MKECIVVVDYGMGNIHSIDKALRYVSSHQGLNLELEVSDDPQKIANADKLVFPGVGAIADCIAQLKAKNLDQAIMKASQEKPLLAICVGMQALFGANEESPGAKGLGILPGEVKLLPDREDTMKMQMRIKVPQIGWNKVSFIDHPLFAQIPQESYFYFVHSYYCAAEDKSISAARCTYGLEFDAAVISGKIFATQFHPEKSHKDGLQLLANFLKWQ